jgi:hypothetical protein
MAIKEVFLSCLQCQRDRQFEIGTSSLGEIPDGAETGEPIMRGTLYDWVRDHHHDYSGNHNQFCVFNKNGETIGRIGFGSQVGYVFSREESM